MLIGAGADPDASVEGSWHTETPLHWAASSDDVEVARALIDGGADLEAPGASIAGGTPLDDAVGYGCWQVARLLVERGARVDRLWRAAALGMIPRAEELLASAPPTQRQLTDAFWQALPRRPATHCRIPSGPRRRSERQAFVGRRHATRCGRICGHWARGTSRLAARPRRKEKLEAHELTLGRRAGREPGRRRSSHTPPAHGPPSLRWE